MNYGLLRSILNTIPTNRASAYTVDGPESLGDFLLLVAEEMRDLRTVQHERDTAERLRRQIADLTEDRDHYAGLVRTLKEQVANLTIQAKFPGKTLDEIADQMWAEHQGQNGSIIPAIKEFRALTGMGLMQSKDAIDAAVARAGGRPMVAVGA